MNDKILKLTGVSGAALIVLLGLHGKALIEAGTALPSLIRAFSDGLPGGALSFLLSLAISGLFFSFVRRWSECPNPARKEFLCHLFALCMGLGVTLGQQYATGQVEPPQLLSAIWIGLIAGLSSPKVVLLLASFTKPSKAPAPGNDP